MHKLFCHELNTVSVVKRACFILAILFNSGLAAQDSLARDAQDVSALFFNASLNNYIFKDDYIFSPVLTADRGALHLEGRYNYEDLQTLSLFTGYTISGGQTFRWEVTPMIGFAFGHTSGVIPALEFTLSYGAIEWYNESEYLLITDGGEENYFYAWSELNYFPLDWLSLGIIGSRTRLFQSDLELQYGFSLGYYRGSFSLLGSLMNFGHGDPYVYLSASALLFPGHQKGK